MLITALLLYVCFSLSCSVQNRALSAIAQAESLKFKLLGGLAVRRACYGVMRYVMENGAKVSRRSEHRRRTDTAL